MWYNMSDGTHCKSLYWGVDMKHFQTVRNEVHFTIPYGRHSSIVCFYMVNSFVAFLQGIFLCLVCLVSDFSDVCCSIIS
jgi:hypothetical protein